MTFLSNECGKKLHASNIYKKVKNKCKDCFKKIKCQVCGKFFTKKWLTIQIEREHQSAESNVLEKVNNKNKIFLPEKRNNENNPNVSTYGNHAYVVIGPRNVGKIYYMLKLLEKIGNKRPIHIITR